MKSLYQIRQDLLTGYEELEQKEGEITPELEAFLKNNDIEFTEKAECYAVIINDLNAWGDRRIQESRRLAELANKDYNKAIALKKRLLDFMVEFNYDKVKTTHFNISIRGNGGAEPLEFTADVPDEYKKEVTSISIDNAKIREALKTKELPFARLLPRGKNLQIK